jgi:ribonucleotide monophosphatase NagD (HAD superfamily)
LSLKLEEKILKDNSDVVISNFFMIGDNPNVDIKGANESGFVSVLVKTGVFEGEENDQLNPAKYVVKDVGEAVDLILRLENLI